MGYNGDSTPWVCLVGDFLLFPMGNTPDMGNYLGDMWSFFGGSLSKSKTSNDIVSQHDLTMNNADLSRYDGEAMET
jgi:hypothetical protein